MQVSVDGLQHLTIVIDHLTTLEERIIHYFTKLDIKKFDWVHNPVLITDTSVFDLTLNEEQELILPSKYRDLILKHSEESINSFWINIRCDYPIIDKKAFVEIIPFYSFTLPLTTPILILYKKVLSQYLYHQLSTR